MRLLVFVIFMVCAALFIGIASYIAGASAWAITWRVIATIVVLQIVYFMLLMLVSAVSRPKPVQGPKKVSTNHISKTQEH